MALQLHPSNQFPSLTSYQLQLFTTPTMVGSSVVARVEGLQVTVPGLSPGTPYYIRAAGVTEFGRTHYSELSTPISTTRKSSPTPLYLCSVLQYVIPCFVLPVTHWCRVRVFFVWFLLMHVLDPPPKKKHTHTHTHTNIYAHAHTHRISHLTLSLVQPPSLGL